MMAHYPYLPGCEIRGHFEFIYTTEYNYNILVLNNDIEILKSEVVNEIITHMECVIIMTLL